MSLAILVDQDVTWQQDKSGYRRVLVPPAPEKLKVIHDLVAGVTGFDEKRGDQLVVETLPFETTLLLEPPALPAAPQTSKQPAPKLGPIQLSPQMLTIGGGAVAALVVGLIVLRGLRGRKRGGGVSMSAALPGGEPGTSGTQALAEPGIEAQLETQLAERDAAQRKSEMQVLSSLKLAPVITKTAEVLAKHLREKIKQEPDVSAQILRTWIREDEN